LMPIGQGQATAHAHPISHRRLSALTLTPIGAPEELPLGKVPGLIFNVQL
jgi:hypothetical protein